MLSAFIFDIIKSSNKDVSKVKGVFYMTVVFNKLTGGYDVTKMIGGHKYRIIKQDKGSPVTSVKRL